MIREFTNEPLTDFSVAAHHQRQEEALRTVEGQLGRERPLLIGGKEVRSKRTFDSLDPSEPDTVVGRFALADAAAVDGALDAATKAFGPWSRVPAEERAGYLLKAAAIMRRRRHELSAWMIREVGKTWIEADADTAEAIDFLEFYAREMLRLGGPQPLTPIPGEQNELYYIPLGPVAVISPWNFPLAILTGMASAAIVAGNTIVLKPSSDSPAIGWQFAEIMREARLPDGVLNFVTGPGGSVGNALVGDRRTRMVAFTGSREVGLAIQEMASKTVDGQIWIKRTLLEMGGKDGIVVDEDTDVDEAAAGVCASAFGFQGQKCSACSRAIVVESVYAPFVEKLTARVRALAVGPSRDPATAVGPVINARARESILDYIRIGSKEGRLVTGGEPVPGKGYFIQPTVIADVDPKARISQEEVFGPVLALTRAADYEQALAFANDTIYGLTGGVYTRDRARIERARREFHVGNLYINRKCTGALVGGHPFGGFNMSGTDSKAGGRDYLLLFTQAKVVSERL